MAFNLDDDELLLDEEEELDDEEDDDELLELEELLKDEYVWHQWLTA